MLLKILVVYSYCLFPILFMQLPWSIWQGALHGTVRFKGVVAIFSRPHTGNVAFNCAAEHAVTFQFFFKDASSNR